MTPALESKPLSRALTQLMISSPEGGAASSLRIYFPEAADLLAAATTTDTFDTLLRACSTCGVKPADSLKLKVCAKCNVARYCGAECQRTAWNQLKHKFHCKCMQAHPTPSIVASSNASEIASIMLEFGAGSSLLSIACLTRIYRLLTDGLTAGRGITSSGRDAARQFCMMSGMRAITRAMELAQRATDDTLRRPLQWACMFVLVPFSDSHDALVKEMLVKHGALNATFALAEQIVDTSDYPDRARSVECCITILTSLASGNTISGVSLMPEPDEDADRPLFAIGAVDEDETLKATALTKASAGRAAAIIVKCQQALPRNSEVQAQGTFLLSKMVGSAEAAMAVFETAAIETIIRSALIHDQLHLDRYAMMTIGKLLHGGLGDASRDQLTKDRFIRAGGMSLLTKCIQVTKGGVKWMVEDVNATAAWVAVGMLTPSVDKGTVDRMRQALADDDLEGQSFYCTAPPSLDNFIRAGGLKALVALARQKPKDASLLGNLGQALSRIAVWTPQEFISVPGAVHALMYAMKHGPKDPGFVMQTRDGLQQVLRHPAAASGIASRLNRPD